MKNILIFILFLFSLCNINAQRSIVNIILGDTIEPNNFCYYDLVTEKVFLADIDHPATGLLLFGADVDDASQLFVAGEMDFTEGTLTPGATYYLDATTPGQWTTDATSGQELFVAVAADRIQLSIKPMIAIGSDALGTGFVDGGGSGNVPGGTIVEVATTDGTFVIKNDDSDIPAKFEMLNYGFVFESNTGSNKFSMLDDGMVFTDDGGNGVRYFDDYSDFLITSDNAIPSTLAVKKLIYGTGSTAPTFTIGSGWGTGASSSITGTDLGGEITITSGTGALTPTTFGTINFGTNFPSTNYAVLFYPSNDNANAISTYLGYASSKAVGSVVETASTGLAARVTISTTYKIYYKIFLYQ